MEEAGIPPSSEAWPERERTAAEPGTPAEQ
jgi:hypothetical protein